MSASFVKTFVDHRAKRHCKNKDWCSNLKSQLIFLDNNLQLPLKNPFYYHSQFGRGVNCLPFPVESETNCSNNITSFWANRYTTQNSSQFYLVTYFLLCWRFPPREPSHKAFVILTSFWLLRIYPLPLLLSSQL